MKKPRNVTRRKRGTRTKQRGGGNFYDNTGHAAGKAEAAAREVQDTIKKTAEETKNKLFNAFNAVKGIFVNKNQSPTNTNATLPANPRSTNTNAQPANANSQQGGLKRKHRTKRYRKGSMNKRTKRAKRTRSRK